MNINDYKYKTEFHAHTYPVSPCGEVAAADVVKNYADIGYHSIVIANHFTPYMEFYEDKKKTIERYLSDYYVAREAGERLGVNVILGCEIKFRSDPNDYLLYGVDENFLSTVHDYIELGFKEFSKDLRSDDLMIIQAHPFRDNQILADPEYLDGIEAFNLHPHHNSRVALAARYAKEKGLIMTAGTDYHVRGHEAMAGTLSKFEIKTSKDAIALLRSRDYIFESTDSIIFPYGIK